MYFLWLQDKQTGPYSLAEVQEKWNSSAIHGETLYWQEGMAEWQPLHAIHHVIEDAPARMVLGGFWRRTGAFAFDAVLLGVVGYVPGLTLFDFYLRLGPNAIFIGLVVCVAYFGLLDSSIGRGQTLGKRALGVRVVNGQGNTISPLRSILRYLIFSLPFWIYKVLAVGLLSHYFWVEFVLAAVAFIELVSLLYLYLANTQTRQSVHDLAVGTYVVRALSPKEAIAPAIPRRHLTVLGIIYLVLLFACFGGGLYLARDTNVQRDLAIQEVLVATGGYQMASVREGVSNVASPTHANSSRICTADVLLKTRPRSMDTATDELAQLVLKIDPAVANFDYLRVSVTYGYDIGIAWSSVSQGYARTPAQWRQRFDLSP